MSQPVKHLWLPTNRSLCDRLSRFAVYAPDGEDERPSCPDCRFALDFLISTWASVERGHGEAKFEPVRSATRLMGTHWEVEQEYVAVRARQLAELGQYPFTFFATDGPNREEQEEQES